MSLLDDIIPDTDLGLPALGPVEPGNPTGCKGFFKNVEIVAEIKPNDRLPCKFDFRQTREGLVGGRLPDGTFRPAPINCPVGPCDDSPKERFQDQTLSGSGTLYTVDTPGQPTDGLACGEALEGDQVIVCLNLTTSLDVDDQDSGVETQWHADTQIRCVNGQFVEVVSSLGPGHIPCIIDIRPPAFPFAVPTVLQLLEAGSLADRWKGYYIVVEAHDNNRIPDGDRIELIEKLISLARERANDTYFESPLILAIELLGRLGATEAIPVFMEHLVTDFKPLIGESLDGPSGVALGLLGSPAIPAMIERVASTTDREWAILERIILHEPEQRVVRRVACQALDAEPGKVAEERLASLINRSRALAGRAD